MKKNTIREAWDVVLQNHIDVSDNLQRGFPGFFPLHFRFLIKGPTTFYGCRTNPALDEKLPF